MSEKPGPFDLCAFCADLCLDRCPVVKATGSTTYSPYAKMLFGWLIEHKAVAPDEAIAKMIYQCTGCLACHEACVYDVDVEQSLFRLRADLVEDGVVPYEQSLFEVPREDLIAAQADAVPKKYFVQGAQAVLFPGCHALLKQLRVVRDALTVFRRLKIEFVSVSEDAAVCCGYPLHAGGFRDAFARHAGDVASALGRYKMVVALSACCAYTMRTLFIEAGIENPPRVTTALELVAPLVARTEIEPLGMSLGYHDSCFLGRHLGQYDLPREVLIHINGMPPIELRHAREEAPCCGAGGGWDKTSPIHSKMAASEVMELAGDAGAETLVSACTTCSTHLSEHAGKDSNVVDILTMIAKWLNPRRKR